jgi:hypothetical protein
MARADGKGVTICNCAARPGMAAHCAFGQPDGRFSRRSVRLGNRLHPKTIPRHRRRNGVKRVFAWALAIHLVISPLGLAQSQVRDDAYRRDLERQVLTHASSMASMRALEIHRRQAHL